MKVLSVQSKDVYVTLEFPASQIRQIIDFNEKSLMLYKKVYLDEAGDNLEFIEAGYNDILKQILREIEYV